MTGTGVVEVPASWRRARREYRHRVGTCGRLLFVAYLPPGTHIEMRCPACGRMHVIDVPPTSPAPIDIEQPFGYDSEQLTE